MNATKRGVSVAKKEVKSYKWKAESGEAVSSRQLAIEQNRAVKARPFLNSGKALGRITRTA